MSAPVITFTKLSADGTPLPAAATEWASIRVDAGWSVFEVLRGNVGERSMSQAKCIEACAALNALGHTDWGLISVHEFEAIRDLSRCDPAVDPAFFPDIKSSWYWTCTPAAWSASSAWLVFAYYGNVGYYGRSGGGFALAVRRVGQ